jgi:hypothetical protein
MRAVENSGASIALTDSVTLLGQGLIGSWIT